MFRSALRGFRVAPALRATRTRAAVASGVSVGVAWAACSTFVIANDADKEKLSSDLESKILEEATRDLFNTTEPVSVIDVVEVDADGTVLEAVAVVSETKEDVSTEGGADADQEGEPQTQAAAFNPETGEINWDCPCLGGMADGPCGEEFKAAFSCFVYSESEPKGIDCIKKFEDMRGCFRRYPEHYKEELYEDDAESGVEGSVEGSVEGAAETDVVETTTVTETK